MHTNCRADARTVSRAFALTNRSWRAIDCCLEIQANVKTRARARGRHKINRSFREWIVDVRPDGIVREAIKTAWFPPRKQSIRPKICTFKNTAHEKYKTVSCKSWKYGVSRVCREQWSSEKGKRRKMQTRFRRRSPSVVLILESNEQFRVRRI